MSFDPSFPSPGILDALPAEPAPPTEYRPPPPARFVIPLHPNFWWALPWCLAMLLMTQLPGGLIGIAVAFLVMFVTGDMKAFAANQDAASMFDNPTIQFGIGLGLWIAHFLMILLSLAALRIVAGRYWHRQVAIRRPAITHVLLVIALTPAFILLANGAYHLVQHGLGFPSAGNMAGMAAFLGSIVATLIVFGFVSLVLGLIFGFDWPSKLWSWGQAGPVAFSAAVLGWFFALTYGFYYVFSLGAQELGLPSDGSNSMQEMEKLFNGWPYPLAVFLIGVMPGISEELWCRAFLGRGLVGKHGFFWGVLTTSFLFGLIHLDPCQGTMAVVLGCVLHYVYLMTRSLWLPMLLHFLNNSLAVTLSRIPALQHLEHEAGTLPVWLFVSAGFLMVAVCWALYETRARLVAPEGETLWKEPWLGVACPPEWSTTKVWTPWPSVGSVVAVVVTVGAFVGCFAWVLRVAANQE